ncbi:NUDIX hydrolase [Halobacillus litoralis]|uniref:NUDIX hydrolase n=1 Tax=Halobacillus litoralis TaxID=45668 RepID=UPI001CD540CA|nr:NUDIX hydrolase [Halobacillus litoralis]MCA0970229.1 NUDIX hydrolase [Halobacillus litoralis]
MKKWKTLRSNKLIDTEFVTVKREHCKLPSGLEIDDYVVTEYPDWVNAVVMTKDQELVLVKQYRHGARDSFLEIPAGKVEGNESDEEGVIREVREETGYQSAHKPICLGDYYVNPAVQSNKVKTFLILEAEMVHNQDLDVTEDIHIEHINFQDFGQLVRKGTIQTQLLSMSGYLLASAYLSNKI